MTHLFRRRLLLRIFGVVFAWTVFSGLVPSARSATYEKVGPYFAPEFAQPTLSPDGKHIAFLSLIGDRSRLLIHELASGKITGLGLARVARFWWLGNNRVLFLAFDKDNDQGYYVQDLNGSPPRQLNQLYGAPLRGIMTFPNDPARVMATMPKFNGVHNEDNLGWSVIQIDVERNSMRQIAELGHSAPVFSASGELRASWEMSAGKWTVRWRPDANAKWTERTGEGSEPPFAPVGMASDDKHLIVLAHDQGDTAAIMSLDPATGERTLLVQRPDRDVDIFIWDSTGRFIIGAEFYHYGVPDIALFAPDDTQLQAGIDRALPGAANYVVSSSADHQLQIVLSISSSNSGTYSLIDRRQGRLSEIGSIYPSLKPAQLGRTENFQFKCHDGLTAFGYIVRPPTAPGHGAAPLVVVSPGVVGEDAQIPSDYSNSDQYLVSRGYAVVHFALRGTSGFGQRFLKAGNFQFADQVPQDIEAGLRFLANSGWIDSKRVAILGSEHGGLLALRLAANSTSYRSVVAINAPGSVGIEELRKLYAVNAPATLDIEYLRARYIFNFSWKASMDRDDTQSQYTDAIQLPELIARAGGRESADKLARLFYPESFIPQLSTPALLIYTDFTSGGTYLRHPAALKSCFRSNHKTYEWYEIDYETNRSLPSGLSEQRLWTKVADYLDKTLK